MIVSTKNTSIGDLVWIPANTPLMCYPPMDNRDFSWRSTEKKEPVVGLITFEDSNNYKVIVGKEEFYVQKKTVYGVEYDYKP